jgi:hypothetical protein
MDGLVVCTTLDGRGGGGSSITNGEWLLEVLEFEQLDRVQCHDFLCFCSMQVSQAIACHHVSMQITSNWITLDWIGRIGLDQKHG